MKPIALKEIASLIGTKTNSLNVASGVCVDSRLLCAGDLFFALLGASVDGHSYIQAAASAGAVGAVVKADYKGESFGLPLLYVDDTLLALQDLGKKTLKTRKAFIVAVTGSLGKTTTKGFIASLLKSKFKISASPGNSNSQIGLPLAILNHTSIEDEIIILEMGMTLPGQLSKLIEIAPPHVSVITTVALVHAENFDSLEEIAKSKAEIFAHSSTKLGIYHLESNLDGILTATGTCQKQSFSTTNFQPDFHLQATESELHIRDPDQMWIHLPLLNIPGAHNRHNFLAAIAVARFFGMSWEEIKVAQSCLKLPERRFELVEKQEILFINDAYNASEMSMKAALDSMPQPRFDGRKIAFFGGIVELGKFSEACHRSVGRYALNHVDIMFCFGIDCLPIFDAWKSAGRHIVWAKERIDLVAALRDYLQPGDVVLLKGSRVKEVWKVLDELFDEMCVKR